MILEQVLDKGPHGLKVLVQLNSIVKKSLLVGFLLGSEFALAELPLQEELSANHQPNHNIRIMILENNIRDVGITTDLVFLVPCTRGTRGTPVLVVLMVLLYS